MPKDKNTIQNIISDSIRRSHGEKVPRGPKWYERGPSKGADRALDAYLSGKYRHGKERIWGFIKWNLWGRWNVHYSTTGETQRHIEEAKERGEFVAKSQSIKLMQWHITQALYYHNLTPDSPSETNPFDKAMLDLLMSVMGKEWYEKDANAPRSSKKDVGA